MVSGLFGWIAIGAVRSLVHWTVVYDENARAEIEAARDRQLELQQVQEDLLKANQVYLYPEKPTVTMSADQGHLNKGGEQVDLYGNVHINRAASGKYEAMDATMPELTVLPDDEKAFTKSPVLITQGKSLVKGVGMQVDNRAQTYVLESQASAVLESKQSKKKK